MNRLFASSIFVLAAACAPVVSQPTIPTEKAMPLPQPLHVDGRFLRDTEGRAVLLHGFNGMGSKTPPYGADTTEGEVAFAAALGMNHVRMILGWASIMPAEGKIDRAYLKTIRRRAEMAQKHDLYVVADMHQDIYGEGIKSQEGYVLGNGAPAWTCTATVTLLDPWMINYIQDGVGACYDRMYSNPRLIARFAEAHAAVLETLGDLPNFLGVELLNEPFIGTASPLTFDQEVLTPFYDAVYARVATAMTGHVLFVEPSIVKNLAALGLLERLPSPQTVYSPHLYDSRQELGEGYDGSTSYLDFRFDVDTKESMRLDAPLWIGEWGNPPAGDAAKQYIHDFLDRADRTFTGRAFWESWLMRERPAIAEALARPYLERGPGEPTFAYDKAKGTLTLAIVGDGKSETWVRAPKGLDATVQLNGAWQGNSGKRGGIANIFTLPPAERGEKASAVLQFKTE